jgi:hypothetical protein
VFAADCLPRREHAAAPGALSHGPGDARPVLRQFPDRHLTLDLDESFDRGEQELRKFNAYYDDWGFLPIHIFDTSGRLVVSVLREAATPSGREILALVKRVVGHIRERFPRARIRLRGDSHYACPEVMRWCEALSTSSAWPEPLPWRRRSRRSKPARRRAMPRGRATQVQAPPLQGLPGRGQVVEMPAPDRVEAGPDGVDTRYIVTNLTDRRAQRLYERKYCQRGRTC